MNTTHKPVVQTRKPVVKDGRLNDIQLVLFGLGEEEFAIEISRVKEIIKPPKITKIPKTPDYVNGVLNLRGTIIPVVDLRKKLKINSLQEEHSDMRIIIVQLFSKTIGMIVDSVSEVIKMPIKDIETKIVGMSKRGNKNVYGVGKLEGRNLIIIDPDKVINLKELRHIEQSTKKA